MDTILCADCLAELDHCHGTLIHHRDGRAECTDDTCAGPDPLRHALRIDCLEIDGGCACLVDGIQATPPAPALI